MRWTSSAGPFQNGRSNTRTSPPMRSASCATPVALVRNVRPMQNRSGRSQKVSPPSTVPGASIRPSVGMPAACVHALEDVRLLGPAGLAGSQRDGAPVGDEERVERIDQIRVVGLVLEHMDRRSEASQQLHEPVVLALGDIEIDRVQEAMRRIVERPTERLTGPLDQDVVQRRGHALRAVPQQGGRHRGRIAVVRVREYAAGTMAAYAVIARIGRVDPHLTVHDIVLDPDLDDDGPDGGLPTDRSEVTVDIVRSPEPGRVDGVVPEGPRAVGPDDVLRLRREQLAHLAERAPEAQRIERFGRSREPTVDQVGDPCGPMPGRWRSPTVHDRRRPRGPSAPGIGSDQGSTVHALGPGADARRPDRRIGDGRHETNAAADEGRHEACRVGFVGEERRAERARLPRR